jgi:hypothetical protein
LQFCSHTSHNFGLVVTSLSSRHFGALLPSTRSRKLRLATVGDPPR